MGGFGEFEIPFPRSLGPDYDWLCNVICYCAKEAQMGAIGQDLMEGCVDEELNKNTFRSPDDPDKHPYVMKTPWFTADSMGNLFPPGSGLGQSAGGRAPDAIIAKDPNLPLTPDNIDALVEIKFSRPTGGGKGAYCDRYPPEQRAKDLKIVGNDRSKIVVLSPKNCGCALPPDDTPDENQECGTLEEQSGEYSMQHAEGVEIGTAAAALAAALLIEAEAAGFIAAIGEGILGILKSLGGGGGEPPGLPGEPPGLPGEPPGTPGEPPGTPGEPPGTPGQPADLPKAASNDPAPSSWPSSAGEPGLAPPPTAVG